MYAIRNGKIFDGERFQDGKALVIEGNKILNIVESENLQERYGDIER